MADEKKPAKPIVDVAHPGATRPSTNSKSVIVSNRPVMQDPMVVADDAPSTEAGEASTKPSPTASKLSIKPLTAPTLSGTKAVKQATEVAVAQAAEAHDKRPGDPETKPEESAKDDANKPEDTSTKKSANPEPVAKNQDSTDQPSKTVDDSSKAAEPSKDDETKTDGTDLPMNPDAAIAEADAAKQKADEAVQKLVDSKEYFLPIKTQEQRRTTRNVIFGILLSIILIAAWVDIALDAGLIHLNGVHALTHIFSN